MSDAPDVGPADMDADAGAVAWVVHHAPPADPDDVAAAASAQATLGPALARLRALRFPFPHDPAEPAAVQCWVDGAP